MQHCRGFPGQRRGRGLTGEWAEGRWLMELMGRVETKKGKIIWNVNKQYRKIFLKKKRDLKKRNK